jgi:hypothetical protein
LDIGALTCREHSKGRAQGKSALAILIGIILFAALIAILEWLGRLKDAGRGIAARSICAQNAPNHYNVRTIQMARTRSR